MGAPGGNAGQDNQQAKAAGGRRPPQRWAGCFLVILLGVVLIFLLRAYGCQRAGVTGVTVRIQASRKSALQGALETVQGWLSALGGKRGSAPVRAGSAAPGSAAPEATLTPHPYLVKPTAWPTGLPWPPRAPTVQAETQGTPPALLVKPTTWPSGVPWPGK